MIPLTGWIRQNIEDTHGFKNWKAYIYPLSYTQMRKLYHQKYIYTYTIYIYVVICVCIDFCQFSKLQVILVFDFCFSRI